MEMEKDCPVTTEEFNVFKKQMQEALSNITDMLIIATNKTNTIAENDASVRIDTSIFSGKKKRREYKRDSESESSSDSSSSIVATKRRSSLLNDFKNELPKKQSYTVTKEMPKTDHIILEKLTFKNIMKFFGDIAQYQEKHGISLPAATMTSTRVRTKIMAKNTDITDHEEFFGMSTHILMRKIQKTIRPEDALAFAEMMTTGVDFWLPDNFKLSFLNFGVFYESILIYKRDFWDAFKYLSFHNAENIPRIDNKPGGMIKIFLQKIPFDYGEKLFRTFTK